MTRLLRPIVLAALFLTGCASANVEVAVDVYSTDVLSVRRLEVADAQALLEGIDNSVLATHEIADARLQLAENLVAAYEAYKKVWATALKRQFEGEAKDIARLKQEYMPEYEQVVRAKDNEINLLAHAARQRVVSYLERAYVGVAKTPQGRLDLLAAQGQVIFATSNLRIQLPKVGEDLGTLFEEFYAYLVSRTPNDLAALAQVQEKAIGKDVIEAAGQLRERFNALARTIEKLRRGGVRSAKELGTRIDSVAAKLEPGKPGAVLEAVQAMARTIFAIPAATGLNDRGELAFAQLGSALDLYVSQIDRLQDPADPAWRELLRPDNESNWAPFFARTSYRAEGDTSVVIARDRLGHFRVQRARNNPAALIQGQLRISRAIASSLADALGAATGVPGAGAIASAAKVGATKTDATKADAAKPDGGGEVAKLDTTTQAAKLDAQARLRHSARVNLMNNLEIVNRSLQVLKEGKTPVPGDLLIKARAVLEGSKPIFEARKE